MVDKLKRADREYTQRNRINDAIDALNTAIDQVQNITATATQTTITGDLDVTGDVGIGTSTPEYKLHVVDEAGDDFAFDRNKSAKAGSVIHMRKSRGTASSPTTANSDDTIGNIKFYGYDGSAYDLVGEFKYKTQTVSGGNLSGYFELKLNDTSGVSQVRLSIDEAGEMTTPASIHTKFCMGDVTTPTGTYISAVNTTAGLTLAQTQTEIDKIRAALINTGIVK